METSIVIPDHLIEEILLRLPVKHLLPWKCVSKHWYALIWDDEFVEKHYHFHYDKHLAVQGDVPLLLNAASYSSDPTRLSQFHLLSKDGACYVANNITTEFKRDTAHVLGSDRGMCGLQCEGLVNGVVCLLYDLDQVVLWNPATRETKDVPVCPITMDYEDCIAYNYIQGFGFDLQSNDFKILGQISTSSRDYRSEYAIELHMYSLKADSWKRIKDDPGPHISVNNSNTDAYFNNGVYYWTAAEGPGIVRTIVSFNFSSEIFKEFEAPAIAETWVGCHWRIGKYKEGLALLVDHESQGIATWFDIWAVTKFRDDDNEVPSSWQLVVKVLPFYVANDMWMGSILDCSDILLIIFSPVNYEVVEGDGNFAQFGAYIYHTSTGTFTFLGFEFTSSYKYVESLFPLSRRLNYIDTGHKDDPNYMCPPISFHYLPKWLA